MYRKHAAIAGADGKGKCRRGDDPIKGFKQAYVRMDNETVDVVVDAVKLTDKDVAQIEDIVQRKQGCLPIKSASIHCKSKKLQKIR